jgi:DNA-binding CsgD family transcriptional regulator
MPTERPIHRPTRLSEQTIEQWRLQVATFRRSVAACQFAFSARAATRGAPRRSPALARVAAATAALEPPAPPLDPPAASPGPCEPDWGPLTRREREVAALIAQGLSNRAIARQLVLTEGTAANHVRRILLRLHFDSRSQVAAWVAGDRLRRHYAPLVVLPRPREAAGRDHALSSSVAL